VERYEVNYDVMKKVVNNCPELPEQVLWTLQRCDGFLDLGMTAQAQSEFQKIPRMFHSRQETCEIILRMAIDEKNWPLAVQVAMDLIQRFPNEPTYHVQLAYSIRRKDNIVAARAVLLQAQRRFKKMAVIPYNLACYECQLGNQEHALSYLKRAVKLNADFMELALDDDDLEPIWSALESDDAF